VTFSERNWSTWLARALAGDVVPIHDSEIHAAAAAAEEHGVAGLLWETLDAYPGATQALRAVLDEPVRSAAARDAIVQREIATALAALESQGVQSLLIKGSALAYTLYPQPWQRPRTDTDILISETSVTAATRALEECGYVRSDALNTGALVSHQIAFERTDQHELHHVLDVHWKIVNPQLLADALAFDDLFATGRSVRILGASGRVPGTIESIMLACIHRLAHHQGHDRLIWLYDLKLLTQALDDQAWSELCALACARRVAALCLDGLTLARARLGGAFPSAAEHALAQAAPTEESRVYVDGPVRKRDVLLSDLRVLDTWGARLCLLREHLLPPASFIRQRYNTDRRFALPALYLHRFVSGAWRWVRH
jgi:hypothetical protein